MPSIRVFNAKIGNMCTQTESKVGQVGLKGFQDSAIEEG